MHGRRRWKWAVPVAVGLSGIVAVFNAGVMSGETARPKPRIVFPPDHAVLMRGNFDLIATTEKGQLQINGKPAKWEAFAPPMRVAHLHLSAGFNELKIDERRVEVFIARYPDDEDAPGNWSTYRWHPTDETDGVKRCSACHENKPRDGRTAVGRFKGYKACFACHKAVEFEEIHSHPLEPLEPCQMCHALHGSKEKTLLKAPVKKLCAECHDS